jgi:hypothetical protein
MRVADTTRNLEKHNGVRCHPQDLPTTVRAFASDNKMSEEKLRMHFKAGWSVAQAVYAFIQRGQPPTILWNNGVRLPRNLIHNSVTAGLLATHTQTSTPRTTLDSIQNVRIVANITSSKRSVVEIAVVHLGRAVPSMCIRCSVAPLSKSVDNSLVFATISAANGKYIAQRQRCATPIARFQLRIFEVGLRKDINGRRLSS